MSKFLSWLSDTQVPRWQLAAGFILATLVTASVSYYSGKWSSDRQTGLAQIAEFRQSAEQLDSNANQLTNAVVDKRNILDATGKFQHAVIVHFHDIDNISGIVGSSKMVASYRSSVSKARVTADKVSRLDDLEPFFLSMAEVRRRQLIILDRAGQQVR